MPALQDMTGFYYQKSVLIDAELDSGSKVPTKIRSPSQWNICKRNVIRRSRPLLAPACSSRALAALALVVKCHIQSNLAHSSHPQVYW